MRRHRLPCIIVSIIDTLPCILRICKIRYEMLCRYFPYFSSVSAIALSLLRQNIQHCYYPPSVHLPQRPLQLTANHNQPMVLHLSTRRKLSFVAENIFLYKFISEIIFVTKLQSFNLHYVLFNFTQPAILIFHQ